MYYHGRKMEGTPEPSSHDFHGHGEAIRGDYVSHLRLVPGMRVLDVGTGFGMNTLLLACRLPRRTRLWSVDPSQEALTNARTLLREQGLEAELVQGTVEQLEFRDAAFDLVTSIMVFHHLTRPEVGVRELHRVTKPGGRIVLVDWAPAAARLPFPPGTHHRHDFLPGARARRLFATKQWRVALRPRRLWYVLRADRQAGSGPPKPETRLPRARHRSV